MAKLKSVDTIGLLNEQIAKLTKRRDKLSATIKDYRGVGHYEGDLYEAAVYEADSTKPNIKKLKKHFGSDWHKWIVKNPMTCLRVTKKSKRRS